MKSLMGILFLVGLTLSGHADARVQVEEIGSQNWYFYSPNTSNSFGVDSCSFVDRYQIEVHGPYRRFVELWNLRIQDKYGDVYRARSIQTTHPDNNTTLVTFTIARKVKAQVVLFYVDIPHYYEGIPYDFTAYSLKYPDLPGPR